jgi:hypothetical protein
LSHTPEPWRNILRRDMPETRSNVLSPERYIS